MKKFNTYNYFNIQTKHFKINLTNNNVCFNQAGTGSLYKVISNPSRAAGPKVGGSPSAFIR